MKDWAQACKRRKQTRQVRAHASKARVLCIEEFTVKGFTEHDEHATRGTFAWMQVTMYHDPHCSACRKVLEELKARGALVTTIEYLVHPPDTTTLRRLLQALKMTARELLRSEEELYTSLELGDPGRSEEELIAAMAAQPELIQGPIVLLGERAVLARPPERLAELFSETDGVDYPEFARQLIAMQTADLAMRDRLIAQGELGGGYHPQMEALHGEHAEALQRMMSSIGYPSASKVGKEASEAAWLVAQH